MNPLSIHRAARLALMSLVLAMALPAQSAEPPLPVVPHLDLQRYSGRWYEIARLPNFFQRKCVGDVSADYGPLPNGQVSVVNRCRIEDGSFTQSGGVARRAVHPSEADDVGRLQVNFAPAWLGWLPMVWGDYWVMDLADDYSTALVGTPNRDYLWLLSRTPTMANEEVERWLGKAAALGFDKQAVERTTHRP